MSGSRRPRNDPYFRWIAPAEDGYVAFARDWMTFIAGLAFERGHTYVDVTGQVATAWIPPDLSLVTAENFDRAPTVHDRAAAQLFDGGTTSSSLEPR
jgi:hypothetical protein